LTRMNANSFAIQIVCSILLLIDKRPAEASKVLELSDRFLEVSNDGTWFVMFYAPWCGHCKKLDPVWHQVSQSLHSSNVRVAKVDCTRFPGVATEYKVKGFPTLLLLKNGEVFHYKGDRAREPLVDYAERMAQPPLQKIVDPHTMKAIINSAHFFLFVGENKGSLWDAFNATAHEFQPYIYFYAVSHSILAMSGVELETDEPTTMIFKDNSYHIYPNEKATEESLSVVYGEEIVGLERLKYWVNHERFPTMLEVTPGNFHQVMKTNKFVVLAVLEEDKVGRLSQSMTAYKEMLKQFAHDNRDVYHEKFIFGWTGSPDLPNSVAMTTLPVPSIIVINATSFHHHLPEEYIEILSPENLAEFLDRVLQNDIQAYGGTGFLARVYRIYYDSSTTFKGMWYGNPVLTTVIIGLPLGFLTLICYSMWCADIMDAMDEEQTPREKED